jgi:hypothetical protein
MIYFIKKEKLIFCSIISLFAFRESKKLSVAPCPAVALVTFCMHTVCVDRPELKIEIRFNEMSFSQI